MIGAIIARKKAYQVFEARNQGDIEGFIDNWAEDVVYKHPGTSSFGGTFCGKDQARRWLRKFREAFPKVHFRIKKVFVHKPWALGATNELAVEWSVRLMSYDGQFTGENDGVTIVHLKNGEAVKVVDYIFNLEDPFHRESSITQKFHL